jgi:UDP-N-acetylmuramate dehydrogenase
MITPVANFDLQAHNSLACPSRAEYFFAASDLNALRAALAWARQRQLPVSLVGGGSNLLCPAEVPGLVLQPALLGRQALSRDGTGVLVRLQAGEPWHPSVAWCLAQGYHGLENLALIPGTAGAAPIQNIGAYGCELADCLVAVEALNCRTGDIEHLDAQACQLGYRDSAFKQQLRDTHIITAIHLQLQLRPVVNLSYPALRDALQAEPSPQAVFAAVVALRSSKLPDPQTLPNAGSFFKNPCIDSDQFQQLHSQYPQMPHYPAAQGRKLAAAWLIEQAGWKGRKLDGVGMHLQQALVLTNPEKRPLNTVLACADAVAEAVWERFAVRLEIEPRRLCGSLR